MAGQAPVARLSGFAYDVIAGLSKPGQKELPSKYLYDDVGSALFDAITFLPEYGLTRADARLLQAHSGEIVSSFSGPLDVAELGSGTGRKTRWVLQAAANQGRVCYYPIDISSAALEKCKLELAGLDRRISIHPVEKPFLDGLREVPRRRGRPLLALFLGSTIGNFDRPASGRFLALVRRCLLPGDALLLGADLLKPADRMLLAYDDPAGVTAAFNLNLLARINRELGATFDVRAFSHQARYNERERRVEMHLRSRKRQTIAIPAADFQVAFRDGETIHTESCHKYAVEELPAMARRAGFEPAAQWLDTEWAFSENLWVVPA